jgi:hypothetical protein
LETEEELCLWVVLSLMGAGTAATAKLGKTGVADFDSGVDFWTHLIPSWALDNK